MELPCIIIIILINYFLNLWSTFSHMNLKFQLFLCVRRGGDREEGEGPTAPQPSL
jgi:hypothetical protein